MWNHKLIMKNSRIFLLVGALTAAPLAHAASASDIQAAAQADPSGAASIVSTNVGNEPKKATSFVKAAIIGADLTEKPDSVVVIVQAAIAAAGGQAAEIVAAALQVSPKSGPALNAFLNAGGGAPVPQGQQQGPNGQVVTPQQKGKGKYMKGPQSGVGGGNTFIIPPVVGASGTPDVDEGDGDKPSGGGSSGGGGGGGHHGPPAGTNGNPG